MKTRRTAPAQRGVSLIEATVALAVMGIGMLGLAGIQSTLQGGSDAAKQRAEAVRLAQAAIEQSRAFSVLNATAGVTAYEDLVDGATTDAPVSGTNADFTLTRRVATLPVPLAAKSLTVDVDWTDRAGQPQNVRLSTTIAGIAPELAATLVVPGDGDTLARPAGRQRAIPPGAKNVGQHSLLKPRGAPPAVVWRFDNVTALIELCTANDPNDTTADLDNSRITCSGNLAVLVGGYLRYALAATGPRLPSEAANPPSRPDEMPVPAQVYVDRTQPSPLPAVECYEAHNNTPPYYTEYLCAVPVQVVVPNVAPYWSGRLYLGPAAQMASSTADVSSSRFKACRYHPEAAYALQSQPLVNRNFLVIRAGDGSTRFDCPSPTLAHQPG